MEMDMTRGNPMPLILKFTIPLVIGNIFQQLYNMADTIIVGRYVGAGALAAVGSTGTIMFLITGFSQGITAGFTVLTAQRYGAKDSEGVKKSVANGILLAVLVTLFLTALGVLTMEPLLRLMNTPEDIFQDAYDYIIVICAGIGANVFYNLLSACLRAREMRLRLPKAIVCISPFLDLAASGDSYRRNCHRDPLYALPRSQSFAAHEREIRRGTPYCGQTDPHLPDLSPAYADLHGLPRLHIHRRHVERQFARLLFLFARHGGKRHTQHEEDKRCKSFHTIQFQKSLQRYQKAEQFLLSPSKISATGALPHLSFNGF